MPEDSLGTYGIRLTSVAVSGVVRGCRYSSDGIVGLPHIIPALTGTNRGTTTATLTPTLQPNQPLSSRVQGASTIVYRTRGELLPCKLATRVAGKIENYAKIIIP